MHPPDCPSWDYQNQPDYAALIAPQIRTIISRLRDREAEPQSIVRDSRPAHGAIFRACAHPPYEYFAGHYRGEPFRCLEFYAVGVDGDPNVGTAPANVWPEIRWFSAVADRTLMWLDDALGQASRNPLVRQTRQDKLIYASFLAARFFEWFLRIHPFANGNGHIGRLIVICVMGHYGFWPDSAWPIDPRPADLRYLPAIIEYRNGDPIPLQEYILSCFV
jgi:hypothetical protein